MPCPCSLDHCLADVEPAIVDSEPGGLQVIEQGAIPAADVKERDRGFIQVTTRDKQIEELVEAQRLRVGRIPVNPARRRSELTEPLFVVTSNGLTDRLRHVSARPVRKPAGRSCTVVAWSR